MKNITGIILNWRTARMSRGAVMNLKKFYPDLKEILIGDDCSTDTHGDYSRAYGRDAYYKEGKLDLDITKLQGIEGTRFIQFDKHQGHGLTLDRIVKYVETPLMLTMDSDMRLVGPGLLEEYIEKYNEDPENIYAVGTNFSEGFDYWKDGAKQSWHFTWVDPFFSLWNMEPLKRYERLSFTNMILPGVHFGTAAFLNYQLQHLDSCHADRDPYKAVIYPDPDRIPQLWHLRRFPSDPPESERAMKWEALLDG
jgi:hypothetical protein